MPVYHVVLFKLKSGVSNDQTTELTKAAQAMVGQIPGLLKMSVGPPLAISAARAKGYDMGLVAVLDKADTVSVYANHPAHQTVHKFREALCEDTLAYDLEFD